MQESRAGCPQRRLSARQSRNSCAPPRRVNRTTGLRSKPTSARSLAGDFFLAKAPRPQRAQTLSHTNARGYQKFKELCVLCGLARFFSRQGAKIAKNSSAFSHKRSRVPESLKSFACSAAWRDCFSHKGAKTAKSLRAPGVLSTRSFKRLCLHRGLADLFIGEKSVKRFCA